MTIANREKRDFRFSSAHVVQKRSGRIHALADEVEVLLHLVHVKAFKQTRELGLSLETLNVVADIV